MLSKHSKLLCAAAAAYGVTVPKFTSDSPTVWDVGINLKAEITGQGLQAPTRVGFQSNHKLHDIPMLLQALVMHNGVEMRQDLRITSYSHLGNQHVTQHTAVIAGRW
jgi:hypothetical protein